MRANELRQYLMSYKELQKEGNDWIDTIPRDIQDGYYDNTYVNTLDGLNHLSMKLAFGDLYEDVSWFLYECHVGPEVQDRTEPNIETEAGAGYCIKNIDSYINYLIAEGLIEND